MNRLIQNLAAFNRKERFHLLAYALEWQPQAINLGTTFCNHIGEVIKCNVRETSFMAMDFHLDWLHAALFLTKQGESTREAKGRPEERTVEQISGTQQDIDLLLAWECSKGLHATHLVLIEAKGATGWNSNQLRSKAERLKAILPDEEVSASDSLVTPHFVLASPSKPGRESFLEACRQLPKWARIEGSDSCHWVQLSIHGGDGAREEGYARVMRCNDEGTPHGDDDSATHWSVVIDQNQ